MTLSNIDSYRKENMEKRSEWSYYHNAILSTAAPHDVVDERALQDKDFWKSFQSEGYPILARWTSDFDYPKPTEWWYMIKDKPFDIMDTKKNYRRKIRKGLDNFDIRVIDPAQYAEDLYQVELEAIASYPAKTRLKLDHDQFVAELSNRRDGVTLAAFNKEDNSIAGYCYDIVRDGYIFASEQTAKPSQEIKHLNAALMYSELDYFKRELAEGIYIVSGERSIFHQTNFQDYQEKYFGFRKAYCRLHILYRPAVKPIIDCLYIMRGIFKYLDGFKLFYKINCVLKMEEIAREQSKSALKEGG